MIRKILILLFSLKPFKRIIPSLIRKLSFSSTGNIILLNDFKINLSLTSSIDREIYLKNEYEKDQLDFVKKELLNQKYDYFFDIGAYIGYYSLSLCKLVNNTAAFEPNQQNFQRLILKSFKKIVFPAEVNDNFLIREGIILLKGLRENNTIKNFLIIIK